jgi:hypothetical protein
MSAASDEFLESVTKYSPNLAIGSILSKNRVEGRAVIGTSISLDRIPRNCFDIDELVAGVLFIRRLLLSKVISA